MRVGIIARFPRFRLKSMDLVLQGNEIATGDLKSAAKLSGTRCPTWLTTLRLKPE